MNPLTRLAMGADSLARVVWHVGGHLVLRRAIGRSGGVGGTRAIARSGMAQDLARLARQDQRNVAAGWVSPPRRALGDVMRAWRARGRLIADAPKAAARMKAGETRPKKASNDPAWFRQNFHFQEEGYLSDAAARLYDAQVEALFIGSGETMRRAGVAALGRALAGRDPRRLAIVETGCGAGALSRLVMESFPRARFLATDRAAPFVAHCAKRLQPWHSARCVLADIQALPLRDGACDAVISAFVFHEIPPKVRAQAFAEARRVLRPGGVFVVVDSLQLGDTPARDGWLRAFPKTLHEPYYLSYLRQDFAKMARAAGLTPAAPPTLAFLSRVMAFRA